MAKIVISESYGGFGLSRDAEELYETLKGEDFDYSTVDRADPILVQVVEKLGNRASGQLAKLTIVEIPGCLYRITEYDGYESIEYPEMNFNWRIVDTPETREKYPEMFLWIQIKQRKKCSKIILQKVQKLPGEVVVTVTKIQEKIENLIAQYDFYVHMIDSYAQQKEKMKQNKAIKDALKKLGVTKIMYGDDSTNI